ncbi:dimethylsulfonioproprionate lyase family protein [Pseudomonas cremoricolorata]|uniref:dimethylsulfonioproprionate lyase family protein n=1 Tax=Pseudomonas cremoricolorata TaxID=157783 RepID=UPI0009DBDCC6|nr:dimethylsulfonioproprionate lyase family protein [Pseudomonas cremoricolorata]
MPTQPPPLHRLLELIARHLSHHSEHQTLVQRLGQSPDESQPPAPSALPALVQQHFPQAAANASAADANLHRLVATVAELLSALRWYQRADDGRDPAFAEGHRNAILLGPGGLAAVDGLVLGLTLMAPGVSYPVHRHPPQELYLVLCDGEWCREGEPWWAPGIGGLVHNAGDRLHSMRAGEQPHLSLWLLFGAGVEAFNARPAGQ